MNKQNKERLSEIDFIRAVAILIILFHHLPAYCFNYFDLRFMGIQYDLSYINDLNRYFGLGTFVFISGYLQQYSYNRIFGIRDSYRFLSRKILRIFPLYIVSLIIFQSIFNLLDFKGFIVHLFGLQILLAAPFMEPMVTLWYVGLIMAYYLVFILLKKFGVNIYQTIFLIILIPVITLALKWEYDFIDKRFFIYFAIFIAGIYSSKILSIIRSNPKSIIVSILCLVLSVYFYASDIYPLITGDGDLPLLSAVSLEAFILLNIIMISFLSVFYGISTNIDIPVPKLIGAISYASYCIYLFHRPFWWGMLKIFYPEDAMFRGLYLALIGIPLLLAASYGLQKINDVITSYMTFKFKSGKVSSHAMSL